MDLCCPRCKSSLETTSESMRCSRCGANFGYINRIPSFIAANKFYEGRFTQTRQLSGFQKNHLTRHLHRVYRSLSLAGRFDYFRWKSLHGRYGTVLDLGCGGGNEFYTTLGPIVGVDLSITSLLCAAQIYDMVVHASASELPFPDCSFDFVVSSDFLGHVPAESKDQVWREIYRVLRKGGRMVHAPIETEGDGFPMSFAKKYPDAYRKYFIMRDGHWGLEAPSAVIRRFRSLELNPVFEESYGDPIWDIGGYSRWFGNEGYAGKSRVIDFLVRLDALVSRSWFKQPVRYLLAPLSLLARLWLPLNAASAVLVCYEK